MTKLFVLLDKIKLFGIEIIDIEDFVGFTIRFALHVAVLLLLVRWLYYSGSRRKDYLFTYFMIGIITFLLCYLLGNIKLQLGFALGLFAVFGIIRYRTSQIPIREMTYLFLVIGLSVVNALVNKKVGVADVVFSNLVIVLTAYGFEKRWLLKHDSMKDIIYDRIDMIKPDRYDELHADLTLRTGIETIKRIEIGKIDFLRDVCRLRIYYEEDTPRINSIDNEVGSGLPNDDD